MKQPRDRRSTRPSAKQPDARRPSLIVINGRVWTGVPDVPEAQAVAITGERIAGVSSTGDLLATAASDTRIIDALGRRVIPGISDSHTHFLLAGLQANRLNLRQARSKQEFIEMVAGAAAGLASGRWLLGGQFAVESWQRPESPTKKWIDPVTRNVPVFLTRADLHQALVNSAALKLAGVTREGPADPAGGEIERCSATGDPTGIIKDAAMDLVARLIAPPDRDEQSEALVAACRAANRWGITSVHDMSQPEEVEAYRANRQRLTVRVHCYVHTEDFDVWETTSSAGARNASVRVVGLKAFVDGSLGSRTAHMREPYADATPETKYPRGMRASLASDWKAFCRLLRLAHDRGVQLAVHAIGDQAIHDLLDVYESFPAVMERRHRVEHVQHLAPADVPRFERLGAIASLQPVHKTDDGPWAEVAIGAERAETMYPWGSLLDSGAVVCFGSDVPVATSNPFAGMAQAATGRLPDGRTIATSQNIAIEKALACYTIAPAFAVFREHELGTIQAGRLADLAILDRDILDPAVLESQVDEIHGTQAFMTIVNGRVVWPADDD